MIKLIAFDWNGTLLSDLVVCWEGANVQLKFCGCKPISQLTFKRTFKVPVIESLVENGANREFCLENSVAVANSFHSFYEKRARKCRTRSGVREILEWLRKNNIGSMIYSNHTVSGIENQLSRLKIKHYINTVVANGKIDGSVHNKNKGEKLYEYVKSKKFKPSEVVSVGDTEEEIAIGKRYGFHTVGITGGYNTVKMLNAQHPDFLIHNMKNLIPIIKKLNKGSREKGS